MIDNAQALKALQAVDFSWTTHVRNIWDAPTFHIEDLHQKEREKILAAATQLSKSQDSKPPLGQIVEGAPGAGKTHFLGVLRQKLASQGIGFILVDMTDVHDFWETTVQGYISSLREESEDGTSQFQLKQVIQYLLNLAGHANVSVETLATLTAVPLNKGIMLILNAINQRNRQAANQYQDIIRALVLLNSDNFIFSDIGYSWLCGLEIEDSAKKEFRFKTTSCKKLSDTIEGLSWVLGLQSSWVLAFDQIDSIVSQHHYVKSLSTNDELSAEQRTSQLIIDGIGGGLMALRDKTSRTLTVVSCLGSTWIILKENVIKSVRDRFQSSIVLSEINQQTLASQLVQSRITAAYPKNLKIPYPTWPFHSDFFADAAKKGKLPRQILKTCDKHRQDCLEAKAVKELRLFDEGRPEISHHSDFSRIEDSFQKIQVQFSLHGVIDESNEDIVLGQWLQTVGYCLQKESTLSDDVDTALDINFPGGKNYPQMHARVRLIYSAEGDREKHLCLRALQRTHHSAYKARLKAAITTAGIDRALSFRRLVIFRTQNNDIPGGAATQQITQKFSQAGGLFIYPTEEELRTIGALHQLKAQNLPNFDSWLQQQQPVSKLPCLQDTVAWLFGNESPTNNSQGHSQPANSAKGSASKNTESYSSSTTSTETSSKARADNSSSSSSAPENQPDGLPVGKRIIGQQISNTISIPLEELTKHTVILAGSGAGKTVLVRRLVEEAAIQGIPAIVIDGANDLARMGDTWPIIPDSWNDHDRDQAERYHHNTEVIIWTPGRKAGRPLSLDPLPNFSALVSDADELSQAIDMARDSLQAVVASGKGNTAQIKRGVLRNALEHFARTGGGDLEYFAEFLKELPEEAHGGISNAHKRAQEMADLLNAEIANNPLLRQSGSSLDPAILLGLENPSKTRLSIINFIGLPGLAQQQQFLNQLAMTLFTWIKKNPAPLDKPLRGLLVIDEAKDFLPSQQSTPCKSSLNRLAAQARKYGLGIIFATQAPKSIDHNIIANCSNQFYGRANSPAAISVVQDQIRQRGGHGDDIAKLKRGQFYVASESLHPPIKVATSLCLSHHPSSPLDESEVLQRAQQIML
ncbi:ATP-binding protein [Leptothoe sp. PORK10 BA2]|uniref:ATP-binding protein n=1 Tax=Leptothoe sp. PORK10 BA2 TaxID=3110254 RepID=UPI002B1F5930|nr:ATP-binding protein [Leptothoe sp. PORK10 BA2]MEA5462542.1 ATP-binding protein [Leptothoe sp. PORK10 BA2]